MQPFQETLTQWATVLGTALSILSLFQSHAWLTVVSIVFLVSAVVAGFYARRDHRILSSARLIVEGRSLDCLNMANVNRSVNKTLVVQEAILVAEIDGGDLNMRWRYSGYCKVETETKFVFSIDADNNTPFKALQCCAYDIQQDPDRRHPIQPFLIGADGISKKIGVPFSGPLSEEQPFSIELRCSLPDCLKLGLDYVTSTQAFDQPMIPRSSNRLVFRSMAPAWIRVYHCSAFGTPALQTQLHGVKVDGNWEYTDICENVAAESTRIYMFSR